MNYDDAAPDAAAAPWSCCNDNAGEAAAAVPTTGETSSFFADMVADYSTDDLFELVWEQEEAAAAAGQAGGGGASAGGSSMHQPALSCLWSRRFSSKPPPHDEARFDPPSEDEMAAWLGTIVKGEEELIACTDDDGGRRPMADYGPRHPDGVPAPAMMGTSTETTDKKVPTTTEGTMIMGNNKEMRKAPAGGCSRRSSHHGEAHNLTEKRRRHKINERLKTLQQLVPGCRSKSNQASTLDQTIHYMKSLQHQVQAMSVGLATPAVYPPVVQPQCFTPGMPVPMPFPAAPMVLGGQPPATTVVPFRTAMLQLAHQYPAPALTMVPAAVAPLYPAATTAAPTSTAVAPGDAMSVNCLHGSSSSKRRGKGCSSV